MIYTKLLTIQNELKAPKSQFNKFGNYAYRNVEDILEALKPLCQKHGAVVTLSDTILQVGERYYIVATARITDIEKADDYLVVSAYAREEENKKGMDASQLTGSTSSYARKYALNGLFAIDDTKDADTTNTHGKEPVVTVTGVQDKATATQLKRISAVYKGDNLTKLLQTNNIEKLDDLLMQKASEIIQKLDGRNQ